MLKKCLSIVIVICMALSLTSFMAYADWSYIEAFTENNMSAKKLVIAKNHIFVASGADNESTDVLNVYNLETRKLVATLALPVYQTGRNYFVENMYADGDYMFISWGRNKGWGDPAVAKYEIDSLISGNLKAVKSYGVRGDHDSAYYNGNFFYTEPGYRTLDIFDGNTNVSRDVMSLSELTREIIEKDIVSLEADADNFYITTAKEIRAYTTLNVYNGMMQGYDQTKAVYTSETTIKDTYLAEGKLYIMTEEGLEILKVSENSFESVGKYTDGGEVTSVTSVGGNLYIYAKGAGKIQVLASDLSVREEIQVKNPETAGITDIVVSGNRIYAADLAEGLTLYSSLELDTNKPAEEDEKPAESYSEELENSPHAKVIELVVGLRIMNLRADGLFSPKGYITRGEFAAAAAKLLGSKANGGYAIAEFTDVPKDSPFANGIYGLANLGILNGFGDGTFRPDEAVLYEHAVKIMVKVLGYYPLVENSNRTCADIATEIGILKSVKPMADGKISRENVARLISNSLETPILSFVAGLNPFKYEAAKEDILLYEMGLRKAKGQITATEFTSLFGGQSAKRGMVRIDETEYPEGTSGAGSYLGRNVTFYYGVDESEEISEIVYVVPNERDTVLTIKAEDIQPSTSKTEFVYFDEDRKTEKENIRNATVIVNGIFDTKFTANDLKPSEGEVTLLDVDSDSGIDVVIVKSYSTYVVDAYGKGIFKFMYGYKDIDLNKIDAAGGKVSVVIDGYRAKDISDISGVKQFSIVSALISRNNEIVELYITNKSAVGMITEVVTNKTMSIEDVEYKISPSHLENVKKPANLIPDATAGIEVFAYLDMFDKIAAVKENTSALRYGYLIKGARGTGLDTQNASFRILAEDENELHGSVQTYKGSENLKVNGVKTEDIYTAKELFNNGKVVKQLIKFSLNHKGEIKEIYTAIDKVTKEDSNGIANPHYEENYCGYTEGQFTYDAYIAASTSSMAFRAGDMGTIEGEPFIPTLDTHIFVIPGGDSPSESEYRMYDNGTVFVSGKYPAANVHFYDINSDYEVGACLLKNPTKTVSSVKLSSPRLVIDSFMKGVNSDGDQATIVLGCKKADGSRAELVLANGVELNHPDNDIWNKKYVGKKLTDLPKGSIISYEKNSKGEIEDIGIHYIPEKNGTYFEMGETANADFKISVTFYTAFAKVVKVAGSRIIFNAAGIGEDKDVKTAVRTWDRNLSAADAEVYLYDSAKDKLTTFSLADILPNDDIFIVKRSVYTELIVVYR